MSLYAAIDLHSNNCLLGVIDQDGRTLLKRRFPNQLGVIAGALAPFQSELDSVAVESTYNWYWLVDGLQEEGFHVRLVHPPAVGQYDGLKHGDDDSDALHLAELNRLGILPEGYIYPRADRPLRDLLRQRLRFVQYSVKLLHSMQSLWGRVTGTTLSANAFRQLRATQLRETFPDPSVMLGVVARIRAWRMLQAQVSEIERWVKDLVPDRSGLVLIKSAPGIGDVLGLTALMETGPIERFPRVGDYSSYCRLVESVRRSNGKTKGHGNRKSGNKFLAWAYIEAAHYALRHEPVRRWYQRKAAKAHQIVAIKAVAHKLARGCYHVLRERVPFDTGRAFG